ncbi:MAG: MFS transporter [Patescibacteria group bacterium]
MASANTQSNTIKYYVAHIFSGASFIVPITILYYLARGLSYFEIGLLESIFLCASFALEIPTGALADRIGRKYVISMGVLIVAIATVLIGLGNSFLIFALAQIIFGIGAALRSGADTALIYDSLIENNQSNLYNKIEGKSYAFFSIAGVIAAPFGAYLFSINYKWPFFIDGLLLFFAALSYFLMHEPKNKPHKKSNDNYLTILILGLKNSIQAPIIRWYIIFTVFLSLMMGIFASLLSQPLLIAKGVNVVFIGYIFSIILFFQAVCSMYAHKIEAFLREKSALFLIFFIPGISFLLMSYPTLAITLFFFIFYYFSKGFQYPILKDYIQRRISSDTRATVLSIQNFFDSLAGIIFFPIFGLLIDRLPITNSLIFLGLITLSVGFILYVYRPKNNTI